MAIIARATRTITDLFDPIQQGTAPVSPVTGMLWLDTGAVPPILKQWNGSAWVSVGLTPEDLQKITPFIASTHTSSTASWTGNAPFPALAHGQQITYLLQQVPTGYATLNLTLNGGGTTGGINCYYSGASRLTTHYSQGNVIRLTYLENNKVSSSYYTGWWADANYDSNNFDRILYNRAILAKSAITAARLIVSDSAGFFHLAAGAVFDVDKPILYAGSAIASGATGTNNYMAFYQVPLTYNFTGVSFTNYKSIYLKGQLAGMQFTVSATTPVTDSPTDEAGAVYMLLGQAYSTTQITLPSQHELYMFNRGVLKTFAQIAAEVEVRVTSAEQKITPDAIVSTVRSSTEYLSDLSGKNRTWLQSTAPTGANVGDLWIDTANGNLLKRWNGSSWANVQDAAVSIAQQTANKINWIVSSGTSASNMTLTSELYSLVSQNVSITADNLTAAARSTLKLEAAEAIQVGGVNLLEGTSETFQNISLGQWVYYFPIVYPADVGLSVGDAITFRVYVKSGSTKPLKARISQFRADDTYDTDVGTGTVAAGLEGFIDITTTINSDCVYFRPAIMNGDTTITATTTEQVKWAKLERGNKATDWSPAPADITDRLDSAELKITPSEITSTVKTGLGYTGTDLDDELGDKANTSALASYSTLTQTAESITSAVVSLGDGGTNLITNSDFQDGWTGWSSYSDASLSTSIYSIDGTKNSGYVICPAGDTVVGASQVIPYSNNVSQSMTFSLFAYLVSGVLTLHGTSSLGAIYQFDESSVELPDTRVNYYFSDFDGTSGWSRLTKTFTVSPSCKAIRIYFFIRSDGVVQNQIRVSNFQLERGTRATAWRAAPTDITDRLDDAEATILSQGTSITQNATAIALKAEKTVTDGLNTRLTTAESKITPTAITTTVKSGIGYTGSNLNTDLSNKANTSALASYSTLTQTADKIALEVATVPHFGNNLIRLDDLKAGVLADYMQDQDRYYFYRGSLTAQGNFRLFCPNRQFSAGTYTLSFKARGNPSTDPQVSRIRVAYGSTYSSSGTGYTSLVYAPITSNLYTTQTKTFTLPSGNPYLLLAVYNYTEGADFNTAFYLREVQLESGSVATAFAPSEYDPANGVITSHINIRSDSIDIASGGSLTLTSPTTLSITAGSTNATAITIKNTGTYFLTAGHLTQASAPFSVTMAGALKSTSGNIGGWTIGSTSLFRGKTSLTNTNRGIYIGTDGISIGASSQAPWFVLKADDLGVAGTLTAKWGMVGRFAFDADDPNGYIAAIKASNGTTNMALFKDDGSIETKGHIYAEGNLSGATFVGGDYVTWTPGFSGNAVASLLPVKTDSNGNLDHSTLPQFARRTMPVKGEKGETVDKEGCSIGALVFMLTKAVQELDERLDKLEVKNGKTV